MIRTIIIDDEPRARTTLAEMTKLYANQISIIAQADSVASGIEAIKKHRPELVFLDIKLPDGSGFDLLEKIKDIYFKVIFVTAYQEHVLKAFKYSALDYILKPVDPDDLLSAIQNAETQLIKENLTKQLQAYVSNSSGSPERMKKIVLKTSEDIFIVDTNDIIRCESDSNYTLVHLSNGKKIMVSKTLKEYEELLGNHGFLRAHHSHLINISYLERFHKSEGGYIVMKDKSEIPVSSRKKDTLLKLLDNF